MDTRQRATPGERVAPPADETANSVSPELTVGPGRARRLFKASRFWVFLAVFVAGILYAGVGVSAVKTGSMRPTIDPGDLVITVNKDIVEPKVGSIIVATPPVAGQKLPAIAHRVIEIRPDGSYKTKGDYNPEPDTWVDRPQDVDKTVVAHVPMGWVRSPLVIAAGIGALALIFMWPSSRSEEAEETSASDEGIDESADLNAVPTAPTTSSGVSFSNIINVTDEDRAPVA